MWPATVIRAMDRSSVLKASGVALAVLLVWWVSMTILDLMAARMVPYNQYEVLALLYPNVFYPALPGWFLASFQPFSTGVWIVTGAWMILLSVVIGVVAVRYGPKQDASPNVSAAGLVVALLLLVTVVEAAASLAA